MTTLKKTLKILLYSVLSFVSFVLVYLLAAYILSHIAVQRENTNNQVITAYLKSNGVHTDIIVPVKNQYFDWTKYFQYKNTKSQDSLLNWIAIGWGDKGFYLDTPTWAELKFSTAFKAVFALSTSAMHTTFCQDSEMIPSEYCKLIYFNNEQYFKFIEYVKASLLIDSNGNSINIKTNANYNNYDAFYEAKGNYSLFHTCNTWTNNALKTSGQLSCLWTPFDKPIFYHYNQQK